MALGLGPERDAGQGAGASVQPALLELAGRHQLGETLDRAYELASTLICASCLSSTDTRTYIAQRSGRNAVCLAESVSSASINSIIPEAAVGSHS